MKSSKLAKRLSLIGFGAFFVGIGIMLLDYLEPLHFLVPVLTTGGVCLMIIATILSYEKSR
ncbi:hypothetical protein MUN89_05355 [Halobacillus salinarum]|uniref:Group-specific protein n=1 Tax=Halobacillus salinarum TaxID=2932257 RepID=A0ABY4EP08_9BACI|nr:hypothetical protein [Halobacillus salinarum]UOQ45374.1 hypothetical protein MUN89_05355 [Halobacillus salinarum]